MRDLEYHNLAECAYSAIESLAKKPLLKLIEATIIEATDIDFLCEILEVYVSYTGGRSLPLITSFCKTLNTPFALDAIDHIISTYNDCFCDLTEAEPFNAE